MYKDFLAYTASFLPKDKPGYLMGIGTPEYILDAVENGIDMFDCVLPTRIARNGTVFTKYGTISLKKTQHEFSAEPIEDGCSCRACRYYSKAYMRHLFKTNEMLGPMLASEHNLHFMNNFLLCIQKSIEDGKFSSFKTNFLKTYDSEKSTGKAGQKC